MGMQGLERRTVNEKRESGGGKGWVHWCVVVHGGLFVTTDGRVMFCAFQGRSRLLPWWRVSLEKQLLHRAGHRSSTPLLPPPIHYNTGRGNAIAGTAHGTAMTLTKRSS